MKATQPTNPIGFDRPASYRIAVQGRVPEKWCDRLEGMSVECAEEAEPLITTLQGELTDQAALAGVLNTLYALQVTVISVERLQ